MPLQSQELVPDIWYNYQVFANAIGSGQKYLYLFKNLHKVLSREQVVKEFQKLTLIKNVATVHLIQEFGDF